MRIPERLEPLFDAGVIHEVVRRLMSGKEATAWIVVAGDHVRVAKVYKEANNRSFRQRADYTEGRGHRKSRDQRAFAKRSNYGRKVAEKSWQDAEVDALYRAVDAGVRAPTPHVFMDGVLIMDLVADDQGNPAPRLFDIDFTEEEALSVFHTVLKDIVRLLHAGIVHGDLSEYNILMAWDGPVIIDMPQAIDASVNRNAEAIFLRDVRNFTAYMGRFAPSLEETCYGEEIWDLYTRSQLRPDSKLTGKIKRKRKRTNTRTVLENIAYAEQEEMRRRGDDQPKRKRGGRTKHGSGSRELELFGDELWKAAVNEEAAAASRKALAESKRKANRKPKVEEDEFAGLFEPDPEPAKKPKKKRRRRPRRPKS